eukprot:Plantae.Rhodophyta-Hildenbrandia_rubra.ctg10738.p1 GENE.Plantae.Rhodophyta-Hildenbrandia_rubra.ctg10738~~Plantae.Rhodophyta-Hildenbrandia_rubra.ctg10738.p1  ORF type:complete len:454 (-),score=105.37 Plantae.Rhodophyta-Hildenbrandia_rubra.ctg10738:390-1751(-)
MTTTTRSTTDTLAELRKQAVSLITTGKVTSHEKKTFSSILKRWYESGGDNNDSIVQIAEKVYGVEKSVIDGTMKGKGKKDVEMKQALIGFEMLEEFMVDVFVAMGTPREEAKVAAGVLIWADRRGVDSHGIGRLVPIYVDRVSAGIMKASAPIKVIKETESTMVLDANLGLGLYVGPYAMNICLEKAKKVGLGMVVVKNSTHYGAAGYYVDLAAKKGCIGVTGTNARPSIAPTFGVQGMLGTNPMTWGMPSDDGEDWPFMIDCATSITQRGKIEKYAREGLPTPPGQVVDKDGRVRTDTDQILKDLVTGQCSLAPIGTYKGYSYATVVELLASALCEGTTSPDLGGVDKKTGKKIPMPLGHWFIAIDIERFLPVDRFKKHVGTFLRRMRDSEKAPSGPGRIWTAGEPEHDALVQREKRGGTMIPEALMKDMVRMREQFPAIKQKYPKFDFEDK